MNEQIIDNSSNKHINKFFWKAPNPMAITKAKDGTYIEVNEAFVRSMGLTIQEIIGQTSVGLEYITAEQRLFIFNEIKENGYAQNLEMEIKIKNNEIRLGLFNTSPVKIGDDALWLTVVTDISNRSLALNAMKDEMLFKSLAAMERTGVIILRGNDRQKANLIYMNEEARKALQRCSLQSLLSEINGHESAYFSSAAGCYCVKTILHRGSSAKIILMERIPDSVHIKERLKKFELTARQEEIAILASVGYSNSEIAAKLFISEYTVKDHLKEIFQRIGVCKRSELCPKILELR